MLDWPISVDLLFADPNDVEIVDLRPSRGRRQLDGTIVRRCGAALRQAAAGFVRYQLSRVLLSVGSRDLNHLPCVWRQASQQCADALDLLDLLGAGCFPSHAILDKRNVTGNSDQVISSVYVIV